MLHLKIVHNFLHARHKPMMFLMMKQIIFTLQCLCTIWLNIVILIQIHQEAYGSLKEMKLQIIMLIWALIIMVSIIPNHLNIKQLLQEKADYNNSNSFVKNTKIVVSIEYLSNFWKSVEMPLINRKFHLELKWIEDCILSSAGWKFWNI